MLFNSLIFPIFFIVVCFGYFSFPKSWKTPWLLVASYIFYGAWKIEYIVLLGLSTLCNYGFACWLNDKKIADKKHPQLKKILWLAIAFNLSLLFFYKYLGFALKNLQWVCGWLPVDIIIPQYKILLPVGISFFTFQAIGYLVDVYRGSVKAEKNLMIFALYLSFFPQLVAGPIERSKHLLPQFKKTYAFEYSRMVLGIQLMLWGLFKKVVIADRLALFVNPVYQNPQAFSGLELLCATYAFAFQVFCDFSGYSDIARGAAQVLGIDLMNNFKRPYFSKSIPEFWLRWHISLSSWFRDYLYFPIMLSIKKMNAWKMYAAIFIIFILSGAWHGAQWTYVAWGCVFGTMSICSNITMPYREKIWAQCRFAHKYAKAYAWVRMGITFHFLVFSFIFFRAQNMSEAVVVLKKIAHFQPQISLDKIGVGSLDMLLAVLCIGVMESVHLWQRHGSVRQWVGTQKAWIRWGLGMTLLVATITWTVDQKIEFIYFQF